MRFRVNSSAGEPTIPVICFGAENLVESKENDFRLAFSLRPMNADMNQAAELCEYLNMCISAIKC